MSPIQANTKFVDQIMGGGLFSEHNQPRFPDQENQYKQSTSSEESSSDSYDGTYIQEKVDDESEDSFESENVQHQAEGPPSKED